MIETHCEVIETTPSRHTAKMVTFEEIETPVVEWFPLSSRFLKYKFKIYAHWAVKGFWYFPIFEVCIIILAIVDICYCIIRFGLPFAGEKFWQGLCWILGQLWNMMVAVCSRIWEVIGESVKAFLVTLLKGLAAVIVILLVIALIKAGSFSNMIDTIPRWLGF